ncbi:MAG: DUF3152 domain-containing protein [Actinobacteria bacterium]|nr:DUF3152 domain-containing protein [Actinomycetota bacterium]
MPPSTSDDWGGRPEHPTLTRRGRVALVAALATAGALLGMGALAQFTQVPQPEGDTIAIGPPPAVPAEPSLTPATLGNVTASPVPQTTTSPPPSTSATPIPSTAADGTSGGTDAAAAGGTDAAAAGAGQAPEPAPSGGEVVVATAPVVELVSNDDGLPPTTVAPGSGPIVGPEQVALFTYTVEAEASLAAEMPTFVTAVEATLGNTGNGWVADGSRAFQRIDRPTEASIRIVLAPPAVVDDMCGRVGLDTEGMYSCWDGVHTMLNADRWFAATPEFTDLGTYRSYLINHEVGHGLGYNHEFCAAEGELAPVMQQQSISLQGCKENAWPYP